jgi:hypothetical protein
MAGGKAKGPKRGRTEQAKEIVFRGSNAAGRRKYRRALAKGKKKS